MYGYRNFPDFRQNKMRCYVMNIIETIGSPIACSLLFCVAKLRIFIEVIKPQFLRLD